MQNKLQQSTGKQCTYLNISIFMWLQKSHVIGHWGTSQQFGAFLRENILAFFLLFFFYKTQVIALKCFLSPGKWKYKYFIRQRCNLIYFLQLKCHCITSTMGQICPAGVYGDRVIPGLGEDQNKVNMSKIWEPREWLLQKA